MPSLYNHIEELGACHDARQFVRDHDINDVQTLFDRMHGSYFESYILQWKLWYLVRTGQVGPQEIKELQEGLLPERQASMAAEHAVALLLREEQDEKDVRPVLWRAACAMDDVANCGSAVEKSVLLKWLDEHFPTVTTMWDFTDPPEENREGEC